MFNCHGSDECKAGGSPNSRHGRADSKFRDFNPSKSKQSLWVVETGKIQMTTEHTSRDND